MIYTCKTFTGYWPVGTAAIIEAESPSAAVDGLNRHLRLIGLIGDAKEEDMLPFPNETGIAILCDGNY